MIEKARLATPASEYPNIEYRAAKAESLPFLPDGSVDMVIAAQAAHWFDQATLWPELSRIMRRGGTLAFWGYKDHVFVDYPVASKILDKYSYGSGEQYMGSHWTMPGRAIVQNKLRDVIPPSSDWEDVTRVEYEPGTTGPQSGSGEILLEKRMTLGANAEYVRTWSAAHGWAEAHPERTRRDEGGVGDVVDGLFEEMVAEERAWKLAAEEGDWRDFEVNVEWGSGILLARRL